MTFIEVRHGANESQVFNSDCYLALILESVKKHCDCQQYDDLMLMNETTGKPVHLTKLTSSNPLQNGSTVFTERGKYVLMAIDKSLRERKTPVYKPLLHEDYIDEELSEFIRFHSQSERRDRHSSMGRSMAASKKRSKSKLTKQSTALF